MRVMRKHLSKKYAIRQRVRQRKEHQRAAAHGRGRAQQRCCQGRGEHHLISRVKVLEVGIENKTCFETAQCNIPRAGRRAGLEAKTPSSKLCRPIGIVYVIHPLAENDCQTKKLVTNSSFVHVRENLNCAGRVPAEPVPVTGIAIQVQYSYKYCIQY